MKPAIALVAVLFAFAGPACAQTDPASQGGGTVSGATIPIMRAPAPADGGQQGASDGMIGNPLPGAGGTGLASPQPQSPSQPGGQAAAPAMRMTAPVPESEIQPKTLPRIETPSQLASDMAIRKEADQELTDYAARVSETCDANFKVRFDWTTVDPQEIHTNSPGDMCGAALQAIDELCATPAARKRVAQEIKTIVCTSGPAPSLALHGGMLLYSVDWLSPNPGASVYSWLASHL